jgi:heme exporter protein D
MQWANAGEFFAMGGYGFYVWGSYGACLGLMVLEPLLARHRQQQILTSVRRERLAQQLDSEGASTI